MMPEQDTAPTWFLSVCDECHCIQTFTTAKARDQWERHHPHQEDPS